LFDLIPFPFVVALGDLSGHQMALAMTSTNVKVQLVVMLKIKFASTLKALTTVWTFYQHLQHVLKAIGTITNLSNAKVFC
jgi:hypothetical protein